MTAEQQKQIDDIDDDRRKKEAILIALLLLLLAEAEDAARRAILAGTPVEAAIRTALAGIPGIRPGLAEVLKQGSDAGYHAGRAMADVLVPPGVSPGGGKKTTAGTGFESAKGQTPDAYKGQVDAEQLTDAMVRHVMAGLGESPTVDDVGPAFDAVGLSEENAAMLAPVATTAIGAGYNPGLFFGWADNPKVLGLRFDNPNDEHTGKICKPRIGVQLPKNDPWWRTSCPLLHFGCRSSLAPLTSKFTMTLNPPTYPSPAPGFGIAPPGAFTLSRFESFESAVMNLSSDDGDVGHWVTIDGSHVYIKDGKVAFGAEGKLNGKTISEAHEHVAAEHDKQAKYHAGLAEKSKSEGDNESAAIHQERADEHSQRAEKTREDAKSPIKSTGPAMESERGKADILHPEQHKLRMSGNTFPIKEQLKKEGWKWNNIPQAWEKRVTPEHAQAIRESITSGKNDHKDLVTLYKANKRGTQTSLVPDGKLPFSQPVWTSKEYPQQPKSEPSQAPAGSRTITKNSSIRNVDAYRSSAPQKIDGKWVVATGYSRSEDDHGGYVHTMKVRDATDAEQKIGRIAELKSEMRAMGAGPDDDRSRESHDAKYNAKDNELRSLEGRPSREQEAAQKDAERAAKLPAMQANAKEVLVTPREKREVWDYAPIAQYAWQKHGKSMSPEMASKMSEEELHSLVNLSRLDAPFESAAMNMSAEELTGGDWRTINGAHVYIKGGVAVAGPAHLQHLIGKTPDEIHASGPHGHGADLFGRQSTTGAQGKLFEPMESAKAKEPTVGPAAALTPAGVKAPVESAKATSAPAAMEAGKGPEIPLEIRYDGPRNVTLYRAADTDEVNHDSTSFGESRDVAEVYRNNPGYGGEHTYRAKVEVDPKRVLDVSSHDAPKSAIARFVGEKAPSGIGVDEWVPRINAELREKGIHWVRVAESNPHGTVTWIHIGGGADDPELKKLKPLNLSRLDAPALNLSASEALTGGEWRTIDGEHVYIKDGSIAAGPSDLKGKSLNDLPGDATPEKRSAAKEVLGKALDKADPAQRQAIVSSLLNHIKDGATTFAKEFGGNALKTIGGAAVSVAGVAAWLVAGLPATMIDDLNPLADFTGETRNLVGAPMIKGAQWTRDGIGGMLGAVDDLLHLHFSRFESESMNLGGGPDEARDDHGRWTFGEGPMTGAQGSLFESAKMNAPPAIPPAIGRTQDVDAKTRIAQIIKEHQKVGQTPDAIIRDVTPAGYGPGLSEESGSQEVRLPPNSPQAIQKLKNSIQEGETILRGTKPSSPKYSGIKAQVAKQKGQLAKMENFEPGHYQPFNSAPVNPQRQFGLFAKDASGQPAEIGEKPGQANLFDRSKLESVKAKEPAVVGSKNASDPKHTAALPFESARSMGLEMPPATEHPIDKTPVGKSMPPTQEKPKMGPLTGRLARIKALREGGMSAEMARGHYAREESAGHELSLLPHHMTQQQFVEADPHYQGAKKNYESIRSKTKKDLPPEHAQSVKFKEAAQRYSDADTNARNTHEQAVDEAIRNGHLTSHPSYSSKGKSANLSRLDTPSLNLDASEGEGSWVTLQGVHIFVGGDGQILKGPAHMVGRNVKDLPAGSKPMNESDHRAAAKQHAGKASAEKSKGNDAYAAQHNAKAEKHEATANELKQKNAGPEWKRSMQKSEPAGSSAFESVKAKEPIAIDEDVAKQAKSGRIVLPTEGGKLQPALAEAYQRHAMKQGFNKPTFVVNPATGEATAKLESVKGNSPVTLKGKELEAKAKEPMESAKGRADAMDESTHRAKAAEHADKSAKATKKGESNVAAMHNSKSMMHASAADRMREDAGKHSTVSSKPTPAQAKAAEGLESAKGKDDAPVSHGGKLDPHSNQPGSAKEPDATGPTEARNWRAGKNAPQIKFASQHHQDLFDHGARIRKESQYGHKPAELSASSRDTESRLMKHFGGDRHTMNVKALDAQSDVKYQMRGVKDGETRTVKHANATKPKTEPVKFQSAKAMKATVEKPQSRAEVAKDLIAHHEAHGGGYTAQDEKDLNEAAGAGNPFTFHNKLPAEIKDFIKDNPATRSMFQVTPDAKKAGGADAFGKLGDRYMDIAAAKAGSPLKAAIATAEKSPDPAVRWKAATYKTGLHPNVQAMQDRAQHPSSKAGAKQVVNVTPATFAQGDSFTVNGHPVTVTVDEDEQEILRDHGSLPDTPIAALHGTKISIDKGSLKHEEFESAKARHTDDTIPFSRFDSVAMNLSASDELTGGEWVTIQGEHVYIKGGTIAAGPAHLKGKKVSDLPPRSQKSYHSQRISHHTAKAEEALRKGNSADYEKHRDAANSHDDAKNSIAKPSPKKSKAENPPTPAATKEKESVEDTISRAVQEHKGESITNPKTGASGAIENGAPIHHIRAEVAKVHGADAASHAKLDEKLLGMWREGKADLHPVSDFRYTTDETRGSAIKTDEENPNYFAFLSLKNKHGANLHRFDPFESVAWNLSVSRDCLESVFAKS